MNIDLEECKEQCILFFLNACRSLVYGVASSISNCCSMECFISVPREASLSE